MRDAANLAAVGWAGGDLLYESTTIEQVKEILDRVLTWPPKWQEDAVKLLSEMERQDASPYHLTDEQVEQVERRRADFAAGREPYAIDEEMAVFWKRVRYCSQRVKHLRL